jgi:hypothetical protein
MSARLDTRNAELTGAKDTLREAAVQTH